MLLLLYFCPVQAQQGMLGLPPEKQITQYVIDFWTTENGIPANTLRNVYQSKDGFVWISSFNGLIRFDGNKFDIYNMQTVPELRTNGYSGFAEAKDSTLWIGSTGGGLVSYKNGVFQVYGEEYEFDYLIESLYCDDKNHKIWIGTVGEGVFIFDIKEKKYERITECTALRGITITSITKSPDGAVWFGTEGNGVVRYSNEKFFVLNEERGLHEKKIFSLYEDEDRTLWVGTNRGLFSWNGAHFTYHQEFGNVQINKIQRDVFKMLWVATENGLFRQRQGLTERLGQENGLTNHLVKDFWNDREGAMWVTTYRGGLCRIRNGKFINYSTLQGIASKSISTVAFYTKTKILVGTDVGVINSIENNTVSVFPIQTQLPKDRIRSILQDSKGNLWIGCYGGALKISPDGKEELLTIEKGLVDNQVRVIYEDSKQNIWIGTRSGGISILKPDGSLDSLKKSNGLSSDFIMSIKEYKDGSFVICTNNAGFDIISSDKKIINYSQKNGLPTNVTFESHKDRQNILWIATNAGLCRIENGKINVISTKNGLQTDPMFNVLEDKAENFWLPCSKGIMKVAKKELNALAKGETTKLNCVLYDQHDGMVNRECTGGSVAMTMLDGSFIFATLGGVAIINPYKIPSNQVIPPVIVKNIEIDGQTINPFINSSLFIPAGKRRFTFDFTALSLLVPEKVKFKYKLENFDNDWIETTQNRQAVYTNIPHGHYTFRVIACNDDGIWNDTGVVIPIHLEPFFYQTLWFRIFLTFFVCFVIWAGYKFRLKRVEIRNKELESIIQLRTAEIIKQKEEVERAYENIHLISQIGYKVTTILDVKEVIRAVYQNVNALMHAECFGIGIFNPEMQRIEYTGFIEKGQELPFHYDRLEESDVKLAVRAFLEKEEIIINNLEREYKKYYDALPEVNFGEMPSSIVFLPLVAENKSIGVITVQSFTQYAYNEQKLVMLRNLAIYASIAIDNAQAYKTIQTKNQSITDSIRYALTIQQAILPTHKEMRNLLSDYFLFYRPRDIVSGDFYWTHQIIEHGNIKNYAAVVDCTGHGVPGAFMSMIAHASLSEVVSVKDVHKPADILKTLSNYISEALHQQEKANADGMDICLCLIEEIDSQSTKITFAGAHRPLYYTYEGALHEIRGVPHSIAGLQRKERHFIEHSLVLPKGNMLYLTTDGYADQNNPQNEKFGSHHFKALLNKVAHLSIEEQFRYVQEAFDNHRQDTEQRDDVTVLGIKI